MECDLEFCRERLECLLDARRHEVNDASCVFQGVDRFLSAVDDRFEIALRKIFDRSAARPDHLQPPRADMIERNIAVHGGFSQAAELPSSCGQHVAAFYGGGG